MKDGSFQEVKPEVLDFDVGVFLGICGSRRLEGFMVKKTGVDMQKYTYTNMYIYRDIFDFYNDRIMCKYIHIYIYVYIYKIISEGNESRNDALMRSWLSSK